MHVDAALREFAGDSRVQAAAQDRVLAARAAAIAWRSI